MIIIEGTPIAKKRPRVTRRGTYNPQTKEEARTRWTLKSQWNKPIIPAGTPVSLEVWFEMPKPKGALKTYHTKRPDLDNLIKFYIDCANSILWFDDSQVVKIFACKTYSDIPRTRIRLCPL